MKGSPPPPDTAPPIVKPRQPSFTYRPILALTDSELVTESGIVVSADELAHVLLTVPSSIIVCQGFGVHLDRLRRKLAARGDFQYRVTPRKRDSRHNDDGQKPKLVRVQDAITNFVGFQNSKSYAGGGRKRTLYHYPIDPIHFIRCSIDELYPDESTRILKLFRFGKEVRSFCSDQGLEIKPSAGGLAAQLLHDPRFYPEPRRKVPKLVNRIARPRLPGNYYRLHGENNPREYEASYLDLSNAHHEMARLIPFPDANGLHAYGRWGESDRAASQIRRWATGDSDILNQYGLFHVRLRSPNHPRNSFPPPYMETGGVRDVWVYSNELDLISELGGEIEAVYSAFVSRRVDPGINRYAKFALEQIAQNPALKPWLKPTLHSVYGVLAARPQPFETGYFRTSGNLPTGEYPMGRVSIPVKIHATGRAIESNVVNVIHRGMIEAELRKYVLRFARQISAAGHTVISVYADSIFIEGTTVPLLPAPWRLVEHCTGLRFMNSTHFISDQINRLPGIPKHRRGHRATDLLTYPLEGKPGTRFNPVGRYQITHSGFRDMIL